MKRIILIMGLCSLFFISCDDFLTREPYNTIGSEEFFSSENDLVIYANGLIQYMMPSAENLTWSYDNFADYLAVSAAQPFLLNGWDYTKQTGWSNTDWRNLYRINYFLKNMNKAASAITDASVLKHYEGVGRFWRAWFYFDKVRMFGDVPWYDEPIDAGNTENLYKKRDSREVVMDKVLEDLNFACTNCSDASKYLKTTAISKYVALALKARICLYEGTYRKYHTVNPSTGKAWTDTGASTRFLNECVSACEALMNSGKFALVSSASNVQTQYRSLFTQQAVNYTEVIFANEFQASVAMHDVTLRFSSAGNNTNRWSPTKEFVNTYLCLDGSRFTDKPDYQKTSFIDETKNRDYRLKQTVITPGFTKKVGGVVTLTKPNWNVTYTGFQVIKFNIDDNSYETVGTSYNSIPVFRYAEILLDYAEAKFELGQFDESIWNKTIKLLRERAGVNGTAPTTADPYLIAYYNNKVTDKWLLEIRRERAIELFMEGSLRLDDLMRWHQGDLLMKSWSSIYIAEKNMGYDIDGDGTKDIMLVDNAVSKPDATIFYIVLSKATYYTYVNGLLQKKNETVWTDNRYTHPIPQTAIVNNSNLSQNNGW
jgi:starch-binding outer membrane protein, SusD/RagB family